jgi:hypothetical protein
LQSVKEIYRDTGTPVYVRFGLALQLVLLNIKDWQEYLKEIWAAKSDKSGVLELPINHGVECKCCTMIGAAESKRERRPGRPSQRREKKGGSI